MSFVSLLLVALAVYYFFFSQRKRAGAFDDAEERSSVYSIIIKNPPKDIKDPEKWKTFFEQKFDDVHVTACTIVLDNNNLIKALVRRRRLLLDLEDLLPVGEILDAQALRRSVNICDDLPWWKKWICLALDSKDIYARILSEEHAINKLLRKEYNVTNVFVTFETEEAARKVLKAMTYPILRKGMLNKELKYNDTTLKVKQADEPSSIRWEHIGTPLSVQILQRLLTTVVTIGLIFAGGQVTYLAYTFNSLYASFVITLLSLITPPVMSIVTSFESHSSESSYSASNYIKVTTFRWVNTAIITHIITPFTDTLQDGLFLIDSIYVLFMVNLLSKPLLQLSDLMGNLNRHYLGPRAPDQRRMNLKFQGTVYDIGERYTELTRVLFLTFFYCTIFPAAFFFAAAILTESYWLDKFSILRSWRQGPNIGTKISIFSNYFFLAILMVYSIVMSYTYAQMPFDNVCNTNTDRIISSNNTKYFHSFVGHAKSDTDDIFKVIINETSGHTEHKFCNQNFLEYTPGIFPPLPSFQPEGSEWMNESQQLFATMYGWSCVAVCLLVGATMFLKTLFFFFSSLFSSGYKPLGKPRQKKFSEVPELFGYIPQMKVPGCTFPLILSDLNNVDSSLVGWKDINVTHSSHNVINGLFTTKSQAFSIAKSWIPIYMPDK